MHRTSVRLGKCCKPTRILSTVFRPATCSAIAATASCLCGGFAQLTHAAASAARAASF